MNLRLPLILSVGLLAVHVARPAEPGPEKSVPHPHDPVLRAEHLELLELVPDTAVTHSAIRDGAWSDRSTWKDGTAPGTGANVLIPKDRTVTLDHVGNVDLHTIRVDGKLQFASDRDTALRVDTLVVVPGGRLIIGTAKQPIGVGKQARLVFTDRGPIDTKWDPTLLSRGLLSHGTIQVHGTPTTSHVALARAPHKGDTTLLLSRPPTNWKKGDRLLLPGTGLQNQDEELTLLAIAGREVTVAPLVHDHLVPAEGVSVPLANLTRNVILESENAKDVSRSGHVMFMHSAMVDLAHVAFHDLGRTDKRKPINDPKRDEQKQLTVGTGANPRGRYAVHFHRTGIDAESCPASVQGCVVRNSPGWGFVNHSSYVEFEDNVACNVAGAAFVTEAGDEIGTFRGNLAVRSVGSGEDVEARRSLQDFGHEGDGFWFQGGGVAVENNIAAGQASAGFIYFTRGLEQEGLGKTRFLVANLEDASWARGQKTVEVGQVPIRSFKGNIAFASNIGIIPRFHLGGAKDGGAHYPGASVLQESIVWNTRIGVHVRYTHQLTLRNLRLIGNRAEKGRSQVGVLGQIEAVNDIRCENLRVDGWRVGVDVRESGSWVIDGGSYDNHINILVPTTIERGRVVEIAGDIHFAGTDKEPGHYDICLQSEFRTVFQGRDPNALFVPDVIKYQGKQLYYLEQGADFVPLRRKVEPGDKRVVSAEGNVPAELLDKTSKELWQQYGLAIAGAVAPADAVTTPRIHGLIGSPTKYPQPEVLRHQVASKQLEGFQLVCYGTDKKKVAESSPTDLRKGWNLLTLMVEGSRRSFLVYGGETVQPGKKYDKAPVK
jgi:hypothetical protein